MTVYEELQKKFIMEHAWEDWKEFRDELTGLVNTYGADSIGIIGAGRCNDIDVGSLNYGRVSLIDISGEALCEAEKKFKSFPGKIDTRVLSLTGIDEADIRLFIDRVMEYIRFHAASLSCEEYEALLNGELDKLEAKTEGLREKLTQQLSIENHDVLLCNGVFSQLFSGLLLFIRSVAHSVGENELKSMEEIAGRTEARLSSMNNRLVPHIIEAMIKSAKKTVIFGSEAPEDDRVEGAFQCLTYLREAYETEERYMDWSFNPAQSVRYRMLIQVVHKL